MGGLFNQSETRNAIILLSVLLIYFLTLILNIGELFFLLLFLGIFAYGVYSQSPIKSAIFGFCIPFLFVLSYMVTSPDDFSRAFFPYFFVMSLLAGFAGFFAGFGRFEPKQKILYYAYSGLFVLLTFCWFLTGIN
ncbi:hypothetical protein [Methanolapillus africanus]